jgi:hypothetical protein
VWKTYTAAAALVLALVLPVRVARARCTGLEAPRWSAHQTLALLLNPTGAEHNLRIGLCVPLFATEDAAFDANLVEFGLSTYVSPIYLVAGPYAQISPSTFFYFRAELHGLGIWPIPFEGAGFYPMSGYDSLFRSADVPLSRAEAAGGWNLRLISVFRGVLELGPLTLSAQDTSFADYLEVGHADFYYNVRQDVVTARSDWVLGNDANLLLGVPVDGGPEIRLGIFDTVRGAPAGGGVVHQLGGIVMLIWERPFPGMDTLSIFARVGGYTHHAVRGDEAGALGAISADHDLGGL